jgi:hypothetical protein
MTSDAAPIFDAALSLPSPLRADLAAKLIQSLEGHEGESANSNDLIREIEAASDELHAGVADLVDGHEALEIIQAAIDRATSDRASANR